jgi:uncharacterized protein (TIGR00266 family)
MKHEIMSGPAAAVAKIYLDQGEVLTCEVGAMIAMSTKVVVETTSKSKGGKGGIMKGIRRMFSGESFFLNHFTSQADEQYLIIGSTFSGDVIHHHLEQGALIAQGGSWLASDPNISIDTSFQGLGKAFLSGEGAFWVKCTGNGSIFLNSFGAIYEVDVDGDYIVDTGHIVAFEDSLDFSIEKAGSSLIGSFLGGEGLVCRFKGRGKLYCQSHNPPGFGGALRSSLKPRKG